MSKYDFELDLSEKTSSGIILNKIKSGSRVLEFGCATGRMTRYMKENLGCSVYIVERDEIAFQTAMQYAVDGLCDDIQEFGWLEKFREIRFEAILFADVLEHLTCPGEVVRKASQLLKDDGKIYVSIPNITHNDIVIKLCNERVDYTETGLLDNTHLHFWGLENLQQFFEECGLSVIQIQGTHCSTGSTEQKSQVKDQLLENILRQRSAGEIYQFVITLDKSKRKTPLIDIVPTSVKSHIYLDTGAGFNPHELISFSATYIGSGLYYAHVVLEDTKDLRAIRFDPIEFQHCILPSVSICQKGEPLHLVITKGEWTKAGLLLNSDDPMVVAYITPENGPVTVDAQILLPGQEYIDALEVIRQNDWRAIEDSVRLLEEDKRIIEEMTRQREEGLFREAAAKQQIKQLQTDICSYIVLANRKEMHMIELEARKDKYIAELEQNLAYYQNLKIIKLYNLLTWLGRAVKKRVKRMLGKG